jgi:hypothetical protein
LRKSCRQAFFLCPLCFFAASRRLKTVIEGWYWITCEPKEWLSNPFTCEIALLLVINHLTRMQRGYICAAGLEMNTGRHIRPVLRGRLGVCNLARNGGLFDMARIIDFNSARPFGKPPESEDYLFYPMSAKVVGDMDPGLFWKRLEHCSQPRLSALFGKELVKKGSNSCGVDFGKGKRSLGCLSLATRPELYTVSRTNRPPAVRMKLSDGEFDLDLSVTDIRLYKQDHVTPDLEVIRAVGQRIKESSDIILGVGLTRPFSATPDEPPFHWLQLNNFHFENDPCWQLK